MNSVDSLCTFPFELSSDISNVESNLYVSLEKVKWLKRKFLLKRICNYNKVMFDNKLYTVSELILKKDEINIDELVMPSKVISFNEEEMLFSMPLVNAYPFKDVLNSYDVSNSQKLSYFKEIGKILEKMKNVRKYSLIDNFYLGDLHEDNFILNKSTGKINVVDLDSCRISDNLPFFSKYLFLSREIKEISKYENVDLGFGIDGLYVIDENTDLFCYIMMILNYVSNFNVVDLSISEYYDYLVYLHSIGVSYELIDIFSLIYSEHNNVNPYLYLDELIKIDGRSYYKVYECVRKKNL